MRIIFLFVIAVLLNTITVHVSYSQTAAVTVTSAVKKSYNGSDISCNGMNDAQITVTASGGSGNYEYSKDNGATYQASNVLTNIPGNANCIIKVRDAKNKTNVSESLYVWVGTVNAVHINTFQRSTYYNSGNDGVSCVYNSDGKITVQADGGSGGLQYSIDNGATFQQGSVFSNLSAGTYQAIAKDANGCLAYSSPSFAPVKLAAPNPIVGKINSQTSISCGSPTGSVTISASGGDGNYLTSIDGGKTFNYLAKGGTYTFSGLAAGNYTVIVKDGNYSTGCMSTLPVNITSAPFTASITGNSSICSGSSANFNINITSGTGNTFSVKYKDNDGNSYTLSNVKAGDNTINTDALSASKTFTLVSVTIPGSLCIASISGSANVTAIAPGTWLGKNSNWNDGNNWSCGAIPSTQTNVTIPATANDPEIINGVASVNNITIQNNASVTVRGTLQIAGTIANSGKLDATSGTIELNGSAAQTISGSSFSKRSINDLIISNSKGLNLSATANDTLNITGFLSFTVSNSTFTTNDNLTLKSTAAGTAAVGDLTNNGTLKGNAIKGNVVVERYINIGPIPGQHNKSWVMISTPAKGQTIYQSWMENGIKTSTGYGTQISGNGVGFDVYSATPALKYYDYATNNWIGITNTNLPVYDSLGYMLFVRGDRSVTFPNFNNTTLRTKGTLIMGTTIPVKVKGGKFQSIGNPYAAEVDIRKIHSTNINTDVIIWDPTLTTGSQYGLGAYQTLYKNGDNYVNLLESPAYGPAGTINNNISSGLAFFVQSFNADGQVYFTEDSKAPEAGKGIAMRQQTTTNNTISLQANLYGMNADGSTFITDGVLLQFGTQFSNDIDVNDAKKLANTSENLSILSNGNSLVIERRNLPTQTDTISYNLTGVSNQNYRLMFDASGLENSGVNGFIEDAYTKTRTPLNMDGTTQLDFTVNGVAATKAANRFRIVFQEMRVMPVTFTSVKATAKNATVAVEWKVENQSKMQQYEIEKSVDGSQFAKVATIVANNNSASVYNWLDQNAVEGYNYYRIRSVDLNGKTEYTSVVKVQMSKTAAQIKVYPNPAVDAKVFVELNNAPNGVYYARLINPLGQTIVSQKIIHQGGSNTETIKWNNTAARGIYQLEIAKPNGEIETVKVVY